MGSGGGQYRTGPGSVEGVGQRNGGESGNGEDGELHFEIEKRLDDSFGSKTGLSLEERERKKESAGDNERMELQLGNGQELDKSWKASVERERREKEGKGRGRKIRREWSGKRIYVGGGGKSGISVTRLTCAKGSEVDQAKQYR